jgi:homoserine dehydrogenase
MAETCPYDSARPTSGRNTKVNNKVPVIMVLMEELQVGIIGLGNVGSGTLAVLAQNADQIALKLGFRLKVAAVCSRSVHSKQIPPALGNVMRTADWREVVTHPDVQIVAELVGGTGVASEIIDAAIDNHKSVVTANKEIMAACGPEIWDRAIRAGINLAMEASVCGGIPIHAVLREGISGDRVTALYGILNGTCNYILTEMEKRALPMASLVSESQRLGFAEADPSADIDGFDARSKLVLLAALAFGEKITPSDIFMEGIRRITPLDFEYARQLHHTIRLVCGARKTPDGLILFVRPALIPQSTILAGVQGAYNAVWVKGEYGEDTFYYGWGAGALPTGVAVVSDLMRVAREIRNGSPERVSPFAHERLGEYRPVPITRQKRAYYLRFRVEDRPGIIAKLAGILANKHISLEAVLQEPCNTKHDLPFVITVEQTSEESIRGAVEEMAQLDFMREAPLALPMETAL